MKIPKLFTLGLFASLLFLCSCTTAPHTSDMVAATELPADVSINQEAGCGGYLIIKLRMDDDKELPFMVDTGASRTTFDKSLEPKLGKRLGTGTTIGWTGKSRRSLYAEPKLYLGNTPLLTGRTVLVGDVNHLSGILGMDCLRHYCIQLDFATGKLRFLKPNQTNTADLGQAFPLTFKDNVPLIQHTGLLGKSGNLLIDVGCVTDGLEERNVIKGIAQILPDCIWAGESYTNLTIAAVKRLNGSVGANVIGLSFLARHLVTFDFPKGIMYLKKTRAVPLADGRPPQTMNDEIEATSKYLLDLRKKGQLPGLPRDDQGEIFLESYSNFNPQSEDPKSVAYTRAYFHSSHKSVTFNINKDDGGFIYHYTIARASNDSPWKLQNIWRTGAKNEIIQKYPWP